MSTLNTRIDKFFDTQNSNGSEGLQIINAAIIQMADKAHDWDACARILGKAGGNSEVDRIMRMGLGLYFGDRVKLEKVDKATHYSGFRFTYSSGKWPDGMAIAPGNMWSTFRDAVADKRSLYDRKLVKEVSDALRESKGGPRAPATFNLDRYAQRVFDQMVKNDVDLSVLEGKLKALAKGHELKQTEGLVEELDPKVVGTVSVTKTKDNGKAKQPIDIDEHERKTA